MTDERTDATALLYLFVLLGVALSITRNLQLILGVLVLAVCCIALVEGLNTPPE